MHEWDLRGAGHGAGYPSVACVVSLAVLGLAGAALRRPLSRAMTGKRRGCDRRDARKASSRSAPTSTVVALCELVQSAAFRQQLRARFGYDVSETGEQRIG